MAAPALIVGLGGTGVKVLTLVKQDLLSTHGGEVPKEVQVLAFDTEKEPGFEVGVNLGGVTKPVRLEPEEYVWIGGNVRQYVREVADRKHPHVRSWFQAPYYLSTLPEDIFFLERGAGMLRQFGRLAVYHDLQRGKGESKIYAKLSHAIDLVQQATGAQTIQAILVTSIAGGTGAGMFLDVAYLMRQIAEIDKNLGVTLRGLIVLPEAFRRIPGGVTPDMRGRAFAAMRETKRFMVNFDWAVGYPMYYLGPMGVQDGRDVWQGRMKSRVFDFLYYLDSRRRQNSLEMVGLERGVAPTIADMISTFLDDEGGTRFEAHKNNIHERAGNRAVYSTTGTFSLVLPMYFLTEGFAHRMALESLEVLLAPEERDRDGLPLRLSPSRNMEEGEGKSGQTAALEFLHVSQVVDIHDPENVVGAMPLTFEGIHPILTRYSEQSKDALIAELAGRDLRSWLRFYTPQGPEVQAVRQKVETIVRQAVAEVCPPSSEVGEKPAEGVGRLERCVADYLGRHLGAEKEGGRREGGEYRRALDEYHQVHLERFRSLLNLRCLNILNGRSTEDFRLSRGAKLGYFFGFLDGLAGSLDTFLTLMSKARDVRENRAERQSASTTANSALGEMKARARSRIPGRAGGAQKAFLEAYQRLVDVLRLEAIEGMVVTTVQGMRDYVQSARERVQGWVETLAVGGNSLYADVVKQQAKVRADREDAEKLPVRQLVPSMDDRSTFHDPEYEEEMYTQYAQVRADRLNELLRDLVWEAGTAQSGRKRVFDLTLAVRHREGAPTRLTGKVRSDNYNIILNRCREAFQEIWERETVMKYLRRRFENNATMLSEFIYNRGGVLLLYEAPAGGQLDTVPANFLRAQYGAEGDETFLEIIKDDLAHRLNADPERFAQIIQSADPFKMTVVRTIDLVPLEGMRSYKDGSNDYLRWRGSGVIAGKGRDILHNFPAEVGVAQYEIRAVEELEQEPRLFDDDVVIRLESRDRFKLFTLGLAYGLIGVEKTVDPVTGETQSYWQLLLPEEETGDPMRPKAPQVEICLSIPVAGEQPSMLAALGSFEFVEEDVREMARAIDYERMLRALQDARGEQAEKLLTVGLELRPEMEHVLEGLPEEKAGDVKDLLAQIEYLKRRRESIVDDLVRPRREEEKGTGGRGKLLGCAKGPARDLYTCFYLAVSEEIRSLEHAVRQVAGL